MSISDNVTIGYNVTILTSVTPISSQDRAKGLESTLPVRIYEGVCIGSNTVIYPGVKINRESIIEPGSVVKDDIPPFVNMTEYKDSALSFTLRVWAVHVV